MKSLPKQNPAIQPCTFRSHPNQINIIQETWQSQKTLSQLSSQTSHIGQLGPWGSQPSIFDLIVSIGLTKFTNHISRVWYRSNGQITLNHIIRWLLINQS